MKIKTIYLFCLLLGLLPLRIKAQNVGINADGSLPAASAMLDVKSTTKGLLIPRMNTAQRMTIAAPANGLMVYDTTTSSFWYYKGSLWTEVGGAAGGWALTGNAGTDTAINFIGTTDNKPLRFRAGGYRSGFIDPNNGTLSLGIEALLHNTSGS